jgi:hypothetical protein
VDEGLARQRQSSVFEGASTKRDGSFKQKLKEDRHLKQIAQLTVEVDFFKESCDQHGVAIPEDQLR